VERSVLGPGVRVEKGAVVRDSVVLNDTTIGRGAQVNRAIVDKRVQLGSGARVGAPEAPRLAVVGKGSEVPEGFVVHPGGEIAHDVVPSDLELDEVPAGLCVYTKRRPWDVP
jgi:glucose-1-phosphate adenylyltransferase